ncbi:hypothetical protein LTR33_012756 [Friedmanniomyces endolithicus]|nr:hypothetical protein LTR33_012756 [Friedmanniomyces endolithicus]
MEPSVRLDSAAGHIRVLSFCSIDGNKLRCSRDVITLPDETGLPSTSPGQEYDALSYVWGSERESKTIYCDGKLTEVPTTLAPALREIWKLCPETRIWADSLCINQWDVKGKNGQVAMMDRVYHCSRRVLVWLDFEDGQPAFDVLKSVLITADRNVDKREIRLAKSALVLCEGRTMEWTDFRKAIALLCQEIRHPGSEFGRKMVYLERFLRFADSAGREPVTGLTDLLLQNWYRGAFDPRDKFYALTSERVLKNVQEIPAIDYDTSVSSLFIRVARTCINTDKNLSTLRIAGMEHRCKFCALGWNHNYLHTHDYVPSWVPNWTQYESYSLGTRNISQTMEMLCARDPPHQDVTDSSDLLELRGFALGILKLHVVVYPRSRDRTTSRVILQAGWWLYSLPQPFQRGGSAATVRGTMQLLKASDDTHDSCRVCRHTSPPKGADNLMWFQYGSYKHYLGPHQSTAGRSIPDEAQSGDWLCQLDGSNAPFVLRPALQCFAAFLDKVRLEQRKPQGTIVDYRGESGEFVLVGESSYDWNEEFGARPGWRSTFIEGGFLLT